MVRYPRSSELRARLLHANHVETIELIPSKPLENVEENFLLLTCIPNNAGGGGDNKAHPVGQLKFKAKQKSAPVKLFNCDKIITDQKVADHFQQAVQNSLTTKEIHDSKEVNNDTWHTLKNSLLEAASKELGFCNLKKDRLTSEKTAELIKLRQQIKIKRDNTEYDTSVDRSITKEYNIINRKVEKSAKKIKMTG